MGFKEKLINALGGSVVKKTSNTAFGKDFLKYGNRGRNAPLYPDWSEVKISDEDMYKGYSYAVIQKRGNKVSSLAKTNLNTWVKPEVLDEFQKKDATPQHPYLKLIEDSKNYTQKQFYKNISIYLDLAGVYYLGVVRNKRTSSVSTLPDIITDVKEFVMLNPYEIRRVVNKNGEVAGYIERKKDGRYREWPKHMIIEMKELNPFEPEKSQWAITDAAKEAVYTINQSADYTRQSLSGNVDAPGIITTDVILEDNDFANFKSRVLEHRSGEPLFGNGAGSIKWDSMQVDLDRAALLDINEINRTTLFAVSGTSKTALGIEQSGTTRDTARVQQEQLLSDTIQPRLEDIVDFLNLDYKRNYPVEYQKTGYWIEVISATGRDYDTEKAATESRQAQFELYKEIADAGYTNQSAQQYAVGDIELSELEIDKKKMEEIEAQKQMPQNPDEGQEGNDDNGGDDEGPDNTPDQSVTPEENEVVLNEPEEQPLTLEACECCDDHGIEVYENDISKEDTEILTESYNSFLATVRDIEKDTLKAIETKVTVNSFTEEDLISEKKKKSLTERLKNALKHYWWILVPLFGENAVNQRNNEFKANYNFKFTNDFKADVEANAQRVAEGHMETIIDDVLEVSNKAYTRVVETAAGELIIKAYQNNPDKFADYFDHIPTLDEVLTTIRNTDILEKNRKIYEKANQMAREGFDRRTITKAIRDEYKDLSEKRATLIARNETSRAFTKSQYEADLQFLNSIGKLQNAYKQLYSRSGNPCKYCQALINKGPIPFTENFLDKGGEITVNSDGKTSVFKADYENIDAGVVHPNCHCSYRLIIKDEKVENGVSANLLNGGFNLASWISNNSTYGMEKEVNTTITVTDGDKSVVIDLDKETAEDDQLRSVQESVEPEEEKSELDEELDKAVMAWESVTEAFFDTTFVGDDYKYPLNAINEKRVEEIRQGIAAGKSVMPIVCRRVEEGKYIVEAGMERLRAFYLEGMKPEIISFATPQDCLKYVEEHADEFDIQ